ncbi:hypothetical protein ACTXT7_008733 [Hymenolepis weldensis]
MRRKFRFNFMFCSISTNFLKTEKFFDGVRFFQHAPLPISPSLFLPLSLTRYNPRCGFLDYIFGLINSWYSAPQLLLALTQTAANW